MVDFNVVPRPDQRIAAIRDTLGARDKSVQLTQSKWWANETKKFRVYLIAACWNRKADLSEVSAIVAPVDARAELAARPWERIPEQLRHDIVNEMHRLGLSLKVMQGK